MNNQVALEIEFGNTACRAHAGLLDQGCLKTVLRDKGRFLLCLFHVTGLKFPRDRNPVIRSRPAARILFMNQGGAVLQSGLRRKDSREFFIFHPDQIHRLLGDLGIRCRDGRHFISKLPHLAPFKGKVVPDEPDPDLRGIVPGNNGPHSVELFRL